MRDNKRCDHRLLLEDWVPLDKLVSIEVIRETAKQDHLLQLYRELASIEPDIQRRISDQEMDPFAGCIAIAALQNTLTMYVADPYNSKACKIRPEATRKGCCCWSPLEAAREGRFITKPSLMRNNSLEVRLDGQSIFLDAHESRKALKLRPMSESVLRSLISQVIETEKQANRSPTNATLLAQIKALIGGNGVSDRRITKVLGGLKPADWKKPGPKGRSSK